MSSTKKVSKNLSEGIKCAPHIDSGDARLARGGNMGLLSCATASDLQSARESPPWEFWVFLANCSWCRWCVWACKSHNLAAAWNSQFCICCFISEQDLLNISFYQSLLIGAMLDLFSRVLAHMKIKSNNRPKLTFVATVISGGRWNFFPGGVMFAEKQRKILCTSWIIYSLSA